MPMKKTDPWAPGEPKATAGKKGADKKGADNKKGGKKGGK